jgi:hypothetical protein
MVQCTVEATRGASSTIAKMLEDLSVGKLECKPNEIAIAVDRDSTVPSNQGTLTQGVPAALDSFSKQISREFSDMARRAVQVARWRVNAHGTHRTICGGKGVGYSLDGKAWFTLPQDINFSMDVAHALSLRDDELGDIELLLDNGDDEPIAHQLFREALENRFPNPRSALILAVTAIETGVKNCISGLVPNATWLVENAPTPPVVHMLREFLPELSKTLDRDNPMLQVPTAMLDVVKDAVTMRNRLVHTGRQDIDDAKLRSILYTTKDILWILDYWRGRQWALANLSPETRQLLQTR